MAIRCYALIDNHVQIVHCLLLSVPLLITERTSWNVEDCTALNILYGVIPKHKRDNLLCVNCVFMTKATWKL